MKDAHASAGTPRRPLGDPYLDVLAKMREELHQALDRQPVEPISHQVRNMRLHDSEQLRGPRLGERLRVRP